MSQRRLDALRKDLRERELDRVLITGAEHVRYLSGFSGSNGWLVVGADQQTIITDFRYRDQVAQQSPGWRLHLATNGLSAAVRELATTWGRSSVGFESAHLTVREHAFLTAPETSGSPPLSVRWVSTERLIEAFTMLKDADEVAAIVRAAAVTDRTLEEVLTLVEPGVTERGIAAEIEYRARCFGADRLAFPPIVASGPNAALPHAQPGDRIIEHGDMVIVDLGAECAGYASDLTRTIAVGEASEKLLEVYGVVAEAQTAALEAVRPGITGVELDKVARDRIAERGYGEAFGHALGHGVGLRVHDAPSVSWRSKDTLEEGMVVTIEPGIYLTGWGGVRIEDLVLVTEEGKRVLSASPKELRII